MDIIISHFLIEFSTYIKIPISVPVNYSVVPVRSLDCEHIYIFDMIQWLDDNRLNPKFECPVCKRKINPKSIFIDSYFQVIYKNVTKDSIELVIYSDGNWKILSTAEKVEELTPSEPLNLDVKNDILLPPPDAIKSLEFLPLPPDTEMKSYPEKPHRCFRDNEHKIISNLLQKGILETFLQKEKKLVRCTICDRVMDEIHTIRHLYGKMHSRNIVNNRKHTVKKNFIERSILKPSVLTWNRRRRNPKSFMSRK